MRHVIPLAACWVVLASSPAWAAPDAKAVFQQKCAGCHTFGGGRTVGPDLKGVFDRHDEAWIKRFIIEPDKMIAEGEPKAKALVAEYGMPMPATGVTSEEADAMMAMWKAESGAAGGEAAASAAGTTVATTPSEAPAAPAGPAGDAARGQKLYSGALAFEKGGPSCISCHHSGEAGLGGGTLAKDLTGLYGRLGDAGLKGALETLPFPLMKDVYKDKGLNAQEVADLTAYFKGTEAANPTSASSSGGRFGLIGLVGAGVLFLGMGLFWPRRRGPGVRKSLVEGK